MKGKEEKEEKTMERRKNRVGAEGRQRKNVKIKESD